MFPAKAGEEIRDVFALVEGAVGETIKFTTDRSARRTSWEENFNQALSVIDHRLRPLTRKSEEREDHLEALLKIENQLRTWEQSLAQSWPEATAAEQAIAYENENKGESLIASYEEQEGLLAAERSSLRILKSLWAANNDLARQGFALGTVQAQALDRMNSSYKKVQETLVKALPLMQPGELEVKKRSLLQAMRMHMIFAGALSLGGVLLMAGESGWSPGASGKVVPFVRVLPEASVQSRRLRLNRRL